MPHSKLVKGCTMSIKLIVSHPLVCLSLTVQDQCAMQCVQCVEFMEKAPRHRHTAATKSQQAIAAAFWAFLDGDKNALRGIVPETDSYTAFRKMVIDRVRSIPWGHTVSYKKLAAHIDNPEAVRAVASVMRSNDLPLVIPCHRVVSSSGRIGGFMGKTQGWSVAVKRRLLENEGVRFNERNLLLP
ncbi:MAG: methylated-DNA--[protein]-cysteine S-methyltransferase [Chitinivibrionales bacterium]|nr:methylated-DNA--[protein]-cysteine S-methyltransferase [Chitinivibrionales bacterium]